MKKNKSKIAKQKADSIQKALSFKNKKEEIRLLSEIVNYDYVNSIKESLQVRDILASDVASKIGVSRSYVSQIFNGTRMVNIPFITRIRREFSIPLELIDTSRFLNNITVLVYRQSAIENSEVDTIDTPYILVPNDLTSNNENIIFNQK